MQYLNPSHNMQQQPTREMLEADIAKLKREIASDNETIEAYREERDWLDGKLIHLEKMLRSDRFLDRVLDELTERAGHPRNSDALGLARWDLKAAIAKALKELANVT